MNSFATTFLILVVLLVLLPSETYAFGAGDIPDFAYLNGKLCCARLIYAPDQLSSG